MFAGTVRFHLWRNQEDRWGQPQEVSWTRFVARMQIHSDGTKEGTAFSCATFKGPRGNDHIVDRTLVALDIEQNTETGEVPPDPRDVVGVLKARGAASCIYTSFSHTPKLPRYRIVAPLDAPIPLAPLERGVDRLISGNFALTILRDLIGVTDKSKWGSASIFYLPRHPPGSKDYYVAAIEGDPIPGQVLLKAAVMGNSKRAMKAALRDAIRAASDYSPEDLESISRFNRENSCEDLMLKYGYRRAGTRWKSPNQHATSQGAVVVLPSENRWVSHSDSDHGVGIGAWSEEGGCVYGDAMALWQFYEHGNNFANALKTLRKEYSTKG